MSNSAIDQVAAIGFVRIRKRKLKGGRHRPGADAATSYVLMRAAASTGKERYLFALGSLRDPVRHENDIVRFWLTALFRMRRHGLDEYQRRHIASEMVLKGAPPMNMCRFPT